MEERRFYGQSPRQPKKDFGKRKRGGWLWVGLFFSGIAVLSASAGAFLALSLSSTPLLQYKLSPEQEAVFRKGNRFARSGLHLPQLTRPVNILVLGMSVLASDVNNAPAEVKNLGYKAQVNSLDGLSDTMMLVRSSPERQKITILSIPRDTRVVIENHGVQKINAANVFGGPALAASEASELLEGVAIDRYVRINVLGVGKLVDALGGLTIYVPKDMKYRDDSQHLYVNLKKGKQHLNGDGVMQLLRFRHDESGDLGRIQRQQMVIGALMEQALNPTTIARIPKLLSVLESYIDTNLTVEELMALVGFAAQIKRSDVQGLRLPGNTNGNGRHTISYWLPDRSRIKTMMAHYFEQGTADEEAVDPSRLRVIIKDGTYDPNAARNLVKALREAGYQNVSIGASEPEPLRVTHIVAEQGDDLGARSIHQALGFGEVRVETSGTQYSDVTIKLGLDWLQKQPASAR